MITKYISSKSIISRLYDIYNIQSDDFVSRLAGWTFNVIRDVRVKQTYVLKNIYVDYVNGKAEIPKEIDKVYGVKVNNVLIDLSMSNNSRDRYLQNPTDKHLDLVVNYNGDIDNVDYDVNTEMYLIDNTILVSHTEHDTTTDGEVLFINPNDSILTSSAFAIKYWKQLNYTNNDITPITYKIVNGWIHIFGCDYGTIEILGGAIPHEYDSELDIYFPMIPDNEAFINAVVSYCLWNILLRGYKHPALSLTANNEFINPAMAYEKWKPKARNQCNALSPTAKQTLLRKSHINTI